MITELTMLNVKGTPKRELTLGPVTLVQGPNFAGKTAIAQAIRIGLLGYDPTLGKLASATYGLASGEKMEVGLALDTGATACRTWEMKRGKLVSGGDKDPLTEPMMMDIDQYFSLTKQGRIDYVMSMAAEGGITNDDVMGSLLTASQKTVPADWTDDHAGQHAELSQQAIELLEGMEQEGASQKDVVDTLLIDWTEKAKKTKAVIAQMAGATQATEQLAEEGPTARDQTKAIGEKQAAIELLAKSHGVMAERAAKRKKLEAALAAAKAAAVAGENEEHLEELRKDLAELKAEQRMNAGKLKEATAAQLQAEVQKANDAAKTANETATDADQQIFRTENQIAKLRDSLKGITALGEVKACPHCGADKGHWKLGSYDYGAEIRQIETDITKLEEHRAKWAEASKGYTQDVVTCREKVETASKALSDWYDLRDRQNYISTRIAAIDTEQANASHAANKVEALTAELEENADETGEVLTQKVKEIQTTIEVANGELSKLQAQQNQYARQCQQKLHAQQAAEERKKQEARLTVLNDCLAEMKLVKEKAANKQWDTFLATINDFTADLLKFRVEFEDGEMGYRDGKRWVSHETMSGMEQALVYMGLGVALAAKSKIKIVVMDEMGILDAMHEWKVIDRMRDLVEVGTISQFVGMTSRAVADIEGVEMIRL